MADDFPAMTTGTVASTGGELAPLPVNNHDSLYVPPAAVGPITAVQTRHTLTVDDCKQHVGHAASDTSLDGWFTRALQASAEDADRFCQNPFVDAAGTAQAIPAAVEMWMLDYVGRRYEVYASGLQSKSVAGVEKQVFGDMDYKPLSRFRKIPGF